MHIIPSHEIDLIKWDDCISKNDNGFIYAASYYLNALADHWHGLIIGDYQAVMPLPIRKKYGITYLYTPSFTQQLGLVGTGEFNSNAVIKAVQAFASYGDYFFNFKNHFIESSAKQCNNYYLDLSLGYETIRKNYKINLQRNLNKNVEENFQYSISENIEEILKLHQQFQAKNISHVTANDYQSFKELCKFLLKQNQCFVREVKNKSGKILSATLLLNDNRRLYNIINTTTDEGKNINANHFLIDQIIREFATQNLLLDFEGSNIPGVKYFYEMFGAVNQPYFHWHYNNLLWPFKLFKH